MKQIKKRIFAGAVCDQIVHLVGENVKDPRKAKARQRFKMNRSGQSTTGLFPAESMPG